MKKNYVFYCFFFVDAVDVVERWRCIVLVWTLFIRRRASRCCGCCQCCRPVNPLLPSGSVLFFADFLVPDLADFVKLLDLQTKCFKFWCYMCCQAVHQLLLNGTPVFFCLAEIVYQFWENLWNSRCFQIFMWIFSMKWNAAAAAASTSGPSIRFCQGRQIVIFHGFHVHAEFVKLRDFQKLLSSKVFVMLLLVVLFCSSVFCRAIHQFSSRVFFVFRFCEFL